MSIFDWDHERRRYLKKRGGAGGKASISSFNTQIHIMGLHFLYYFKVCRDLNDGNFFVGKISENQKSVAEHQRTLTQRLLSEPDFQDSLHTELGGFFKKLKGFSDLLFFFKIILQLS